MAFLGIRIPQETGRLLTGIEVPGEKEGTGEYHITLLCFEDNWPITEISKALEATYDVISQIKPFLIKINKITCFPKREDNPCPIIAKVESDDLHDLQKKLKKSFDKHNVDYDKKFKDYKPHITLSYADKEIDEFKIDPLEISIQEAVLWGGDYGDNRIFITFPLKGPEKHKKSSLLLQKIDMFYKMALNPYQPYLTSSEDRRHIER
jgi:2'-5' RNA ligase